MSRPVRTGGHVKKAAGTGAVGHNTCTGRLAKHLGQLAGLAHEISAGVRLKIVCCGWKVYGEGYAVFFDSWNVAGACTKVGLGRGRERRFGGARRRV